MIYFYYGTNTDRRRQAVNKILESFADAPHAVFESETVSGEQLASYLESRSLFGETKVILCLDVLSNEDVESSVLKKIKEFKDSKSIFIFSEKSVLKDVLAVMKKNGEDAQGFDLPKSLAKKDFGVFALTDAFARRDKKESWVILQKAFRAGKTVEEIHGLLFWQVKTMLAVGETPSAELPQLKLNPFVLKKAQTSLKQFSIPELKTISSNLVSLLYEGRRDGKDMQVSLEQFVLTSL